MSKGVGEMVRSRSVTGEGVGGDGGSPEGFDRRSARRRRFQQVRRGRPGAGAALERGPEAGRGAAGCCEAQSLEALPVAGSGRRDHAGWIGLAQTGPWPVLSAACTARQGDLVAETLDAAKLAHGELSMENELLRERALGGGAAPPFSRCGGRGDDATLSEATGRPYGIQRVCRMGASRSALYVSGRHASSSGTRARSPRGGVRRPRCRTWNAAGGDSGRSRPLAVPGRGPSEGPRAAADLGRDPGRADAECCG